MSESADGMPWDEFDRLMRALQLAMERGNQPEIQRLRNMLALSSGSEPWESDGSSKNTTTKS